jgi:hypothetical protein
MRLLVLLAAISALSVKAGLALPVSAAIEI